MYMLGCLWLCFVNKFKRLMQHMKGIRCLQIVLKPGFLAKNSEQLFKKAHADHNFLTLRRAVLNMLIILPKIKTQQITRGDSSRL